MPFAADLHLHSRHASGVSQKMTVEAIAHWAQRKGVDLLATGDCLQPVWRETLTAKLEEAEPGLFALKPDVERVARVGLPPALHRSLRYVVSTEVCCAPPGTPELGGLHHLIYFSSLESAGRFARIAARHGDLGEGRPTLTLTSRELLELVLAHDERCHLVPAHVFNPWFSTFGSVSGGKALAEIFGELAPRIFAVETGLTSTPAMCRRVSELDRVGLFSSSDAHSLENIGRECTLLEIEPSYDALFTALRTSTAGLIAGTLKFPLERTRYYRNRCSTCKASFAAQSCPHCGRRLVTGSHDRLEIVADRSAPIFPPATPPWRELLPLAYVVADLMGVKRDSKRVEAMTARLVGTVGHERFILTEAPREAIERASLPQLAQAIIRQRSETPGPLAPGSSTRTDDEDGLEGGQLAFEF